MKPSTSPQSSPYMDTRLSKLVACRERWQAMGQGCRVLRRSILRQ
jgi:hypothetical protein